MYAHIAGEVRELTLPPVHEEVLPGLPWGAFDELMTPAYWRGQAWQHTESGTFCDFRLGRTLQEEVAACLLGAAKNSKRAETKTIQFRSERKRLEQGSRITPHERLAIPISTLRRFQSGGHSEIRCWSHWPQ
jgi:hypothetical protein